MSEIDQKYHPAVETHLVTEGQNIGRIRNADFAHEFALEEKERQDGLSKDGWSESVEQRKETEDVMLKKKIAHLAIEPDMKLLESKIVRTGLDENSLGWSSGDTELGIAADSQDIVKKAASVGESYDELRGAASRNNTEK